MTDVQGPSEVSKLAGISPMKRAIPSESVAKLSPIFFHAFTARFPAGSGAAIGGGDGV